MKLYPQSLKSLVLALARIAAALFVIVFLLLYCAQERLIFPASKLPAGYEFHFVVPFEEKVLTVDRRRVDSLLFHPVGAQGLIYFFTATRESVGLGEVAQELASRAEMDVWIIDYPGYGKSEGKITSEALLHDVARAFYREAEKRVGDRHLVLYGRSIGSGLAARQAAEHPVAGLILESPYFSFTQLLADKFFWAPRFLVKYALRSDQWVAQVKSPTLMIHGTDDEVIPFAEGRRLAAQMPTAEFRPIVHGHHNDLSEFPEYWSAVLPFFTKIKSGF